MKRLIFTSIFVGAILIVFSALYVRGGTLANVVNYLLFDGPYLSRTIYYSAVALNPSSSDLLEIISKPDYEDRHWFRLDISGAIGALKAIGNVDPKLIENMQIFSTDFQSIKDQFQGPNTSQSDDLANAIVALVNRYYLQHKNAPGNNNARELLTWPFHAENHLINVASTGTACGTTAEATLALLRDAGFKTRLLGISNFPKRMVFNHVFLEYYSFKNKKWVMVDPMINAIAKDGGRLLSTFEMLQNKKTRNVFNHKWAQNGEYAKIADNNEVYRPQTIAFFSNQFGPIMSTYYFAVDPDTVAQVKSRVSEKNFKPDWL